MKMKPSLCTAIAIACTATATFVASPAAHATGTSGNRIVGLWSNLAQVRPCGTDLPTSPAAQTLLFHGGGTVSDNPLFPPGGAPIEGGHYERNQGLGTWEYNPTTNRYWIRLQFDNFMDGVFVGRTTIDRDARLRKNGTELVGSVWGRRYDAAGNLMFELCGSAVATRL